jgi:hypothetical protein
MTYKLSLISFSVASELYIWMASAIVHSERQRSRARRSHYIYNNSDATGFDMRGAGLGDFRLEAIVVGDPAPTDDDKLDLQTVSNTGEIKRFHAHSGHYTATVTFHLAKGIDIAQHIR